MVDTTVCILLMQQVTFVCFEIIKEIQIGRYLLMGWMSTDNNVYNIYSRWFR